MNRAFAAALLIALFAPALARADDDGESSDAIEDDPHELILRPLVKSSGALVLGPSFLIGRNPFTTPTGTVGVTAEAVRAYLGIGVTADLTVGAAYSMVLNDGVGGTDFSARGPLTLYGSYSIVHHRALDVVVGGDAVINFTSTATELSLRAGATARLTIARKVALYTGTPLAGTPQTHQLSIGLYDQGRTSLALPLGIAVQATPEVYAYLETTLAEIYIVNAPTDAMGNTKRANVLFADVTPLTLGAYYSPARRMDLGGSLGFGDLGNAQYFLFTLGARFHTGP